MSEQDEQVLDATSSNEEENLDLQIDDTEDVEALKAQIAEKDAFARQAIARAKKAEAENKELKTPKAPATQNTNSNALSEEAVEIKILRAQGVPQDEVDYLRKLAAVNGTGLIEAQNDELYSSYKSKKEADSKAEKARLGASKGSGSVKQEKTISSSGLSDAEHKELWKRQNGL